MRRIQVDDWLGRVIPRACALCGLTSGARNLCAACLADLPWLTRPCEICARQLPEGVMAGRCGNCDINTQHIDRVEAALIYSYPVDRLISAAKFDGRPELARAGGDALLRAMKNSPKRWVAWRPDVLIPVPLHRKRLAVRGFNQAVEIARPVSRGFGLRMDTQLCVRRRATQAQSGLSAPERRANMRNAFSVCGNPHGLNIALIDDVITTGSTTASLAGELRRAGALRIVVWALARVQRS